MNNAAGFRLAVRQDESCSTCLFFAGSVSPGAGGSAHMESFCRRNPPSYVQLSSEAAFIWCQPRVDPDLDLCGEWTPTEVQSS